jgi:hypothetical protein
MAAPTIEMNGTISADGSWDHRPKGSLCVVAVVNPVSKEFIDYEIT